jgi:hypothetical protein
MRGTWQTTSGGAGALLGAAAVLAVGAGAAMLAEAVAALTWVIAAVMFLAGAAIIYAAVRLNRRGPAPPPVMRAECIHPAPARPFSAPPRVATLPPAERHEHLHFHGVNAAEVAAILAARTPDPGAARPGN